MDNYRRKCSIGNFSFTDRIPMENYLRKCSVGNFPFTNEIPTEHYQRKCSVVNFIFYTFLKYFSLILYIIKYKCNYNNILNFIK